MSKNKENKEDAKDMKWDVLNELNLFSAVMNNRPVGINKHFKMALIVENLASSMNRPVNSESIWKHLTTMYDLNALDEMEPSTEFEEEDFCLPSEFANLQQLKESTPAEKKAKKVSKETPKREPQPKEPVKKELPRPSKETPQKSQKVVKHTPQQPSTTETPKTVKTKILATPKTRDSAKKTETPKEKREPRELKNLGTPDVKPQLSRSKETRSGGKSSKEESPIPTRRSLSTTMAGTKRPTRGSIASSSDSKATSPAVSTTSSRSSTPVPTPKRRRI